MNVSIDTLDPQKFREITRWGDLDNVLIGLEAAKKAGLAVKLNAVALKGVNEFDLADMVAWAGAQGFDMTIIEVMPMGDIGNENRVDQYLPLSQVRADLSKRFTLVDSRYQTPGPARYVTVSETGKRLGFITPLTHNFCESCNRVRITCTGQLYMCLGQDDNADLSFALRHGGETGLEAAITGYFRKPKVMILSLAVVRPKPQMAVLAEYVGAEMAKPIFRPQAWRRFWFCCWSGSGKTTLESKLFRIAWLDYDVATFTRIIILMPTPRQRQF